MKEKFYNYIQNLQETICQALEQIDTKGKFVQDLWEREQGGGGRTRVLQNGKVFEKAGVNISAVDGDLPTSLQQYFKVAEVDFFACGLSLVIHPVSPMVPTVHANWRYFEMYDKQGNTIKSWFGGGQDLTPYYLFEQDVVHFHQVCKQACDKHDLSFYKDFKQQCDQYFWNSHRSEARGVGGLFFDRLEQTQEFSLQDRFEFVKQVGDSFLHAYLPIVERTKDLEFEQEQVNWQQIRRGRYVEFNLVHDKGTLFGLKTNGRMESILMSLPPVVKWVYDHKVENNSAEAELLKVLKYPKNWV
ncbi:oxygen-dependent coproporphyrinogen oxidase [Myroides sp. LJL119]